MWCKVFYAGMFGLLLKGITREEFERRQKQTPKERAWVNFSLSTMGKYDEEATCLAVEYGKLEFVAEIISLSEDDTNTVLGE